MAVFAATGARSTSRKELDIIGFLSLAAVTGLGGRDAARLIPGVLVFWVVEPTILLVCALIATTVIFRGADTRVAL